MTTAVQHRRGTTAEHSTFTGLEGEVTIDTTKDTAVIHDGSLAGGYPLAKETLANVNPSTLSAITGAATASDDLFLMYDTSALSMKKISRAELNNAITIEALDTVDINGGTIDGTTIGGTTAAAGSFTTLSATSLTNTGNTTLGDSSTDTVTVNGYMGVGGGANAANGVLVSSTALTSTSQTGIRVTPTSTSAATSATIGGYFQAATAAAAYTSAAVVGVSIGGSAKGAGSTITDNYGLFVNDQTQGTNNYGISSLVSSGTNKWNIYASGTAANYFAGNVGVGTTSTSYKFDLALSSSGNLLRTVYTGTVGGSNKNAAIGFSASSNSLVNIQAGNDDNTVAVGVLLSGVERLKVSQTEAVFNDPGNDYDFRVESDTNTHALFVDAGNEKVNLFSSGTGGGRFNVNGNTAESYSTGSSAYATYQPAGTVISQSSTTAGGIYRGGYGSLLSFTIGDSVNSDQVYIGVVSEATPGVSTSSPTLGAFVVGERTGNTSWNETLRVTSGSTNYLRMASGTGGIQFNGDTAAANALDDYEEGTFTPSVEGTTTAGTATYIVRSGKYTKIGNVVYFTIYFNVSGHTGTGNMVVTGLPFTAYAAPADSGMASIDHINGELTVPANSIPVARVTTSSTIVPLYSRSTAGTITDAALALDGVFAFTLTGFYYV